MIICIMHSNLILSRVGCCCCCCSHNQEQGDREEEEEEEEGEAIVDCPIAIVSHLQPILAPGQKKKREQEAHRHRTYNGDNEGKNRPKICELPRAIVFVS